MNRPELIDAMVEYLETKKNPSARARELAGVALRRMYEKRGLRVVEKRDGAIEPLDFEKLALSIARASDEEKKPMPQADLSRIVRAVERKLGDKTFIKSSILRAYVLEILEKEEPAIAERYLLFRKE